MKKAAIIPLALAVGLGAVTFIVGRGVLGRQVESMSPPPEVATATVVVAAAGLPAGHMLRAQDVKLGESPAEAVTSSMFRTPGDVEGRVLAAPLEPGQVLRASLLAPDGTTSALQARVPTGMRAVTIGVDDFSGLGGFVTPGVRVDLIATLIDTVTSETFASTVVENVMVSAVGSNLEPGTGETGVRNNPRRLSTITLLVTPTQAAAIDLAFSKSRPRLVLRSGDDHEPILEPRVTLGELAGRSRPDRLADESERVMRMLAGMQEQIDEARRASREAADEAALAAERQANEERERESVRSVRIFRGGSESRQQFDDDGKAKEADDKPAPPPARETQHVQTAEPAGADRSTHAAADTGATE